MMDIKEITGKTELTCLLGSPVAHSLSPLIHNEAYKILGLDCVYLCFDVSENTLIDVVKVLKQINVTGFNCTMPNKTLMSQLCDELSPAARLIGAVNTVVNKNGKLTGHNTDGIGYMTSLTQEGFDLKGEKMTILGCGGAASAIMVQAALDGVATIEVFCRQGRFLHKTETLISKINRQTGCHISLQNLKSEKELRRSITTSRILCNATPVGMFPNTEDCLIRHPQILHRDLIVSDIIYHPIETKLVHMAKETGCPTVNGLSMLLYQGAEAFHLWTGYEMPIKKIKDRLLKTLSRQPSLNPISVIDFKNQR